MHILLRGSPVQRLRLATGLVLFTYVATHLANHALGLVSVPAMLSFQELRTGITRSLLGTVILLSAIFVHMALGVGKVARRTTWRMPVWEAVQIASGFAIPYFLASHVIFTGYANRVHGVNDTYLYELALLWPGLFTQQSLLLLLVWTHGCIGVHFWLRLAPWYPRISHGLAMFAAALPLLAIAGFASAGRAVQMLISDPDELALLKAESNWPDPALRAELIEIYQYVQFAALGVLAALAAVFALKWAAARTRPHVDVQYLQGPKVKAPVGPTLLEISRMFGIPHRSVCGGRGRCSTCRVRVTDGLAELDGPSPTEAATLLAIEAPENVRLACQIRPRSMLEALRLLIANRKRGTRAQQSGAGLVDDGGREQRCTVMFLDVRGFTEMSQDRLPYDVVFLLNRLFDRFGEEIRTHGGWIDKYLGDGLMAVFGMDGDPQMGARNALLAARAIDTALEELNKELAAEIDEPFRIGVGLHAGLLVIGRIGDAISARTTVIGRTVNVAARLEGFTKDLDVQLVASLEVLEDAGLDDLKEPTVQAELRGISEAVPVVAYKRGHDVAVN